MDNVKPELEIRKVWAISPDNEHFALAGYELLKFPEGFSIYDLDDGKVTVSIDLGNGKALLDIAFDRGGAEIIGVVTPSGRSGALEIHRWNLATGLEDISRSPSIVTIPNGRYYADLGFAAHGEYLVSTPSRGDREEDTLSIVSTTSPLGVFRKFRFSSWNEARLAAKLIRQSEKIAVVDDDLLISMSTGLTVEVKKEGNTFSLVNGRTGNRLIAQDLILDEVQLRIKGRYMVVISSSTSLWSTETGALITGRVGERGDDEYVDFADGGSSIITIGSSGRISKWFMGNTEGTMPLWVRDLGSAVSGLEVNENLNLVSIPQERLSKIRNDYLNRLREAAARGDEEAKFVLINLEQ